MLLLLVLACTGYVDCESLDLESCSKNSKCVVVAGQAIVKDEASTCTNLGRSEPVACTTARDSCGFFSVFAEHNGTCYRVGGACVPDNWTSCNSVDTGDICD
jgi:hypothetical protein